MEPGFFSCGEFVKVGSGNEVFQISYGPFQDNESNYIYDNDSEEYYGVYSLTTGKLSIVSSDKLVKVEDVGKACSCSEKKNKEKNVYYFGA